MNRRRIAIILVLISVLWLTGCSSTFKQEQEEEKETLRVAMDFVYASLDAHKDYYGWYTSFYGMTETLFQVADNNEIVPCLAGSGSVSGNTWTIELREEAAFSNGKSLTAEMVVRNLTRAAELNARLKKFRNYEYQVMDEHTFTITTDEANPTLFNELADTAFAIMDLDDTNDFNTAPVTTGPFVIASFDSENMVRVIRNENYWNGEVQLEEARFIYIPDETTTLLAMQNGEIDGYVGVTNDALEIYQADRGTYTITDTAATRLQFYIMNVDRLEYPLREAINLTVDAKEICTLLSGTLTPAVGPFNAMSDYGQVTKPAPDVSKAKKVLKEAGYSYDAKGNLIKDGTPVQINIAYYAGRSLGTVAAVMQEQLKQIGIQANLICYEDPDATYIASGDFDIALYCMIADNNSDPYYFIANTIAKDSFYNCGGYENAEVEEKIALLSAETDALKRAELANEIVQKAMDDQAFYYLAHFNKVTVTQNGATGFSETSPFDYYGLTAKTDKE